MKQFALTLNLKEIMELIDSFPFLEKKEKREMVVYLEGYLCRVGKPDFIKSALRRTCR